MMNAATKIETQTAPVLVVGLGETGWSVVRYLCDRGESVVVSDTRELPPYLELLTKSYPDVRFIPCLDENTFDRYCEVVVSPGIAVESDAVVGDIELFLREATAPVIAITGSNGKSTVTELVGRILIAGNLDAQVGGNIGTPALDLLATPRPDYYVLELSSFQLETTHSLQACSATVLNISEDHMDRYADLEAYTGAKQRIYQHAAAIVVNRDDRRTLPTRPAATSISFGLDAPQGNDFGVIFNKGERYIARGPTLLSPVSAITMKGDQNIANVLAALALIAAAGIEITDAMVQAALDFPGLPHRCQLVGRWHEVSWINDSKGTNVGATLAAIRGATKPLILIAGGTGQRSGFQRTRRYRARSDQIRHSFRRGCRTDRCSDRSER